MWKSIGNFFLAPSAPSDSTKLSINATDWKKVLIHTLLVAAAAGVTVLGQQLSQIDFGQFSALVVPFVSSVLIFAQKWLKENTPNVSE